MAYQERYIAYAASNGMTADEMLANDKASYPHGCMYPFMCWIQEKKEAFRTHSPKSFINDFILDDAAFTDFLNKQSADIAAAGY